MFNLTGQRGKIGKDGDGGEERRSGNRRNGPSKKKKKNALKATTFKGELLVDFHGEE